MHVWGRSGAGAEAEAAAAAPLLVPELDPDAADARFPDGSPTLDSGKPYTRDLPYGWEYLMEARARSKADAPCRTWTLPTLLFRRQLQIQLEASEMRLHMSATEGVSENSADSAPCACAEPVRPSARAIRPSRHHRATVRLPCHHQQMSHSHAFCCATEGVSRLAHMLVIVCAKK